MSMSTSIKLATRRALQALKSFKVLVTVQTLGPEIYDTDTKTVTRPVSMSTDIFGYLTSYTEEEILAGAASPEHQRLTFEYRRMNIEIVPDDQLVIAGDEWKIVSKKTELSGTLLILKIERR